MLKDCSVYCLSYTPIVVTSLPYLSFKVVVIVIRRPSSDTTRRLVATTRRNLVYEATTVRESTRFKDTGSISRFAPVTITWFPS